MKYAYPSRLRTILAATFSLFAGAAQAAPFTPGNLVVARVGDGSNPLTNAATEVFLDEYTRAGVLVQSIALPTFVSGNNRILTASGNGTSELAMTTSADGHSLVVTGFGAAPGTPAVAATAAADITRIIGLIGADGSFNTSTSTGSAFSAGSIRAAATVDGTSFYSVGTNSGLQYQPFSSGMTAQLTTAPVNIRSLTIAGGNLYITTSTSPYVGVSQVGTGLPATAGQTVTVLPGFPATAAGASPYGIYFADLSPTVPGVDVAYVADDRASAGGIQKWSLVGTQWVLNGTIAGSASAAVRGLSGSATGATVALAATSSNGLFILEDTAGYNTTPSLTSLPAAVATAGTNTAFRGLAFAPVAALPTITSFTPAGGPAGTVVTLTGTNFTGATSVTLNGVAITGFAVVNSTSLIFTVPVGAGAGLITVTTPGGTATSPTSFNLVLATAASHALPGLSVYPNPASDFLTVELPKSGTASLSLRDLTGRLVLGPVRLENILSLRLPAQLAPGTYLLEVEQGTVKAVRRIEKK